MLFIIILLLFCAHQIAANECQIYLTLGLTEKNYQNTSLELNWGPDCHSPPTGRLNIFAGDPSISNPSALEIYNATAIIKNSSGKFLTTSHVGSARFPKGWNRDDVNVVPPEYAKGKCIWFYVARYNDGELLSVECLKINPNWMSKVKHIAQMPLKDLFIPGTHASGAFFPRNGKIKSVLIKDYVVSQHFDIWQQLVFGIRYLDLSIGFKGVDKYDTNNPNNFWIVNENMFVNELRAILKDIKRFVRITHEVIILDFSSFPIGFYKHPERHSDLLHLLQQEIGDIAYRRNLSTNDAATNCFELSVDDIRRDDKYLIILYPIEELPYPENESDMLCPTWKRFSTAFMNTSQALDYMRLLFSKKDNSPVQDEGWIFHAVKSMEQSLNSEKLQTARERASILNPKVANWLKGPWSLTANVVAMDYFSNTNIIDVAIYANMQKAFNMANKNLVNFEIASN